MGASFSAGSPFDNPSPAFLFHNGTTVEYLSRPENKALSRKHKMLSSIFALRWPSTLGAKFKKSHAEKPILLPTGIAHLNWSGPTMTPQIVPLQILKIGSLAIIAVPCEVTTMAGRRFKKAVLAELASAGVKYAVISSLANSYTSYLATREEYAKQWYEGAATQFGPHQQAGFQQEYVKLCRAIVASDEVAPGPTPPDVTAKTVDFTPKVRFDDIPMGKRFGDVLQGPAPRYARGDVVVVRFWGGHPNNNFRIQDSYLRVERLEGDRFVTVARDWDPETTYQWARRGLACSIITISWDTRSALPGTYRIVHTGDRKSLTGRICPYEGATETFTVHADVAREHGRQRAESAATDGTAIALELEAGSADA